MIPPLADDPRLDTAIACFNRGEYEDAADIAEDLYFEAAGHERPVARVLLQFMVGMVHVEHRQVDPARERIGEGIATAKLVTEWLGLDGPAMVSQMTEIVRQLEEGEAALSPRIKRRA
jgi:hypothetical protein